MPPRDDVGWAGRAGPLTQGLGVVYFGDLIPDLLSPGTQAGA